MNIDTWVKLSQIATPFVVISLGYFVSKSVNKYIQNQKITSEFHTRWSEEFIAKCKVYSDTISNVTLSIDEFYAKPPEDKTAFEANFAVQVNDIKRSYYKLEFTLLLLIVRMMF